MKKTKTKIPGGKHTGCCKKCDGWTWVNDEELCDSCASRKPEPKDQSTVQGQMELLPCPFCGDKGGLSRMGQRPPIFVVDCEGCGAEGGRESTKEAARAAWNRRITPSVLAP